MQEFSSDEEDVMAKIIGNIKPEDDYTHPLGPEPNFNESVYFNFFDRTQNRGGFVRIGNRANEGYAEMTVIVWNPMALRYLTMPSLILPITTAGTLAGYQSTS